MQEKLESDESNALEIEDSKELEIISFLDVLKIVFSRQTAPHAFLLTIFLFTLGIFSRSSSQFFVDMILILGFGFSIGYLATAILMRFETLKDYSVGSYRKILSIPLILSSFMCIIIWYLLEFTEYASKTRNFLSFGFISIFILWQFAQAWWMRVPFKEIALNRMIKVTDKNTSEFGKYVNVFAPIIWSIIGFGIVLIFESQGTEFSNTFKFMWFISMILLGTISFYLLYRMYSKEWSDPMVSVFSAYFSIGYWSFLTYHLGVMLYSLENQPSFVFDLIFMIITIMLVIYSLSAQTLRSEVRKNKQENKSKIMNRHNVIFYAISFTMAYGASNFFLASEGTMFVSNIKSVGFVSHLIVIVSGILVLLLVNYTALVGRGLIDKGFVESLRNPKDN